MKKLIEYKQTSLNVQWKSLLSVLRAEDYRCEEDIRPECSSPESYTHTAQRNDSELNQVNRFTLFFFHLADAFDPEELTVYSMGVQPMTLVLLPLCNIR